MVLGHCLGKRQDTNYTTNKYKMLTHLQISVFTDKKRDACPKHTHTHKTNKRKPTKHKKQKCMKVLRSVMVVPILITIDDTQSSTL